MDKKILIGSLIRDRGWILHKFLQHISEIDYPKNRIGMKFIVNDSTDESVQMLETFQALHWEEYLEISIVRHNFGAIKDKRRAEIRPIIVKNLAIMRNEMLDSIDDYDYLLSIDCDILPFPDVLKKLLEAEKEIVAGIVNNLRDDFWPNLFNQKTGEPWRNYPRENGVFECDVTGAVMLISKAICHNKNIRYGQGEAGEDVDFCNSARDNGYKIYAHPRVTAWHAMRQEDYLDG